ncbi:MAG: right-handed parallel beta-helix repeat-containing protein [Candidatus Thermoplasmatota archaeon]|nr:right-handed parallel beta-helix repeat-containing protein [Candidatus Thermoplasmatota archaeon]MEE3082943.1 right-handed parallel beta-helix repeat-containing protein [Candidatus Thermoplasmatota archaeon]
MQRGTKVAIALIGLLLITSISPTLSASLDDTNSDQSSARTTTTWTGTRILTADYTVPAGDTLVIDAGSNIFLDDNVRLYVEGELDVTGTASNPVVMAKTTTGIAHEGIQFNATSRNRGSLIQHLVIEDSEWGITIYNSNPSLNDVYIENPDYVGIDMFDNADPVIQRLTVQDGGQDVAGFSVNTRYGIAISAGASSRPIVLGATFDGLTTRGINMWGGADGYFRDISISNITHIGNQGWKTAGIWVEDSLGLFDNITVDRTDDGVWVEHMTTGSTTRPTFRHLTVTNSMYSGVNVEQDNRSNFNSPLNAIFENLTVTGSGSANAKTPGLCNYAIGLNTTGVDMTNVLAEDNDCNGFKAYMIDSATIIRNLTVRNSGEVSATSSNDQAGVFIRSANWAPHIENLHVSGSAGHGIMLSKSSLTGSNWNSDNNSEFGFYVRESHPQVYNISLSDNGRNGLRVYDSSNVELFDLSSVNNGISATIPDDGYGLFFKKSNDLVAASKNVSCTRCSSTNDTWGGVRVIDSVDLQFHNLIVNTPGNSGYAVDVDNTGMIFNGFVEFHGMHVAGDRVGPIVQLIEAEAKISNVTLSGTNNGIAWDGSGASLTSSLEYAMLTGINCIEFTDLHLVIGNRVDLTGCSGQINLRESTLNLSNSMLGPIGSSAIFDMTGQPSTLRWIDSGLMDPTAQNIGVGSIIDKMWTLDLWAVNQNLHGLPYAIVNLSFSDLNSAETHTMPYSGNAILGPYIYQRADSTGLGNWINHSIGCEYDGQRTDFTDTVTEDGMWGSKLTNCVITLTNQPPLIIWSTPDDEDLFSSNGVVTFNATDSWDLDDDPMTFSWSSNLDGIIGSSPEFTVNDGNGSVLSDGQHQITLTVCDNQGNCANETRDIELRNLPPVVSITTDPAVDFDGTLRLYRTAPLNVNLTGTYDPEGDTILCHITVSYRSGDTGAPQVCSNEWNESFLDASAGLNQFDYTISITDDINPSIEIILAIELVNELPHPDFTIIRSSNTSGDIITLDGTASFDPEGDAMTLKWESDLLGELPDDGDGNEFIWTGRLPAGNHDLTLSATDDQASHIGIWSSQTQALNVENSPPISVISSHTNFSTDSSILHTFMAHGSGDWDLQCDTSDMNWSDNHLCNDGVIVNADNIAVRWDSSEISEALGTDWTLTTRLPVGTHILNFTVDDGINLPTVSSIEVEVVPSAPVLIISSPAPQVEVYSDGPILFDFRNSFDADGNQFWVNISSNLMGTIVENGSTDYWYNDYLEDGEHTLTFTATDETGRIRSYNQTITVLPTGPHAVISGLTEGDSIDAGGDIHFNGSTSYDYDDDIIQYLWHHVEGDFTTEIANDADFTMWFRARQEMYTFTLTVRDSRGESDTAWINVTISPTVPVISDLSVNLDTLEAESENTLTASVYLSDLDGTTQLEGTVNGKLSVAGEVFNFVLKDDGEGDDEVQGDDIYTGTLVADIGTSNLGTLEIWAADGDYSSNEISKQIPIEETDTVSGIAAILSSPAFVALVVILLVLTLIGGLYILRNKRQLAADLEMIESWGAGLPENDGGFGNMVDDAAPDVPDLDADAPPAMSDFGDDV